MLKKSYLLRRCKKSGATALGCQFEWCLFTLYRYLDKYYYEVRLLLLTVSARFMIRSLHHNTYINLVHHTHNII